MEQPFRIFVKYRIETLASLLRAWELPVIVYLKGPMGKFDFRHIPEPAAKEVYTLGRTKFFRTEFEMKCDEDREIFIANVLCRVGLKGSVELVQVHTKRGLVFVAYDGFKDGLCLAITSVPLLETMKFKRIIRSYSPLETPQLTFPDWHP